jgi:hypothetical protein
LVEPGDDSGFRPPGLHVGRRDDRGSDHQWLDAMHGWIQAMQAEGHPIPAPTRSERHEPLADLLAVLQPRLYS